MVSKTPYRTEGEPRNDVSRLPIPSTQFGSGARALASGAKKDRRVRGKSRETGDIRDAAPHRSTVPLGSGRFSAEQRGRAIEQQCQSTAQGSLPASVARIPNTVLQRQALHDAAAALAAHFNSRSKRMNPFVRRERSAPRPGTHPLQKRILRATSWCSAAAAA